MRTTGASGISPRNPSVQGNSHQSRQQPITLDDLPTHREFLLKSDNTAARALGAKVAKLQCGLEAGELSPETHQELCYAILEAAEMLNGSDQIDEETLARAGLSGIDSDGLCINQAEYLAVCDDLKLQLDPYKGVVATRMRHADLPQHPFPSPLIDGIAVDGWGTQMFAPLDEAMDAVMPAALSTMFDLMQATAMFSTTLEVMNSHIPLRERETQYREHSQLQESAMHYIEQRNLERRIPALELREENLRQVDREALRQALESDTVPRAGPDTMNEASQAIVDGSPVAEVIRRFELSNVHDLRQLHDLARERALDLTINQVD